ncbi:MAG TPA: peptide MFS transporter [Pyrinomonadaceae bacterium]|nr:peptide MFS transporter [Pyrinomonadaceae bacterium]
MNANVGTVEDVPLTGDVRKHPKGLYVLFATEMWERFSFYSMLALFTLYLRDPTEGFGWTAAEATTLYANYLMFVYASPLIGGLIADRITGYRKAVMIGGFFFMAGHGLLSIPALWAVYLALTCLVIGNGFFKPNVSTMVGNLYPEGSHLKDRAYNIFYMGINIGAFFAPVTMEIVRANFGFHPAFAVAAFGMLISVGILWYWKGLVQQADAKHAARVAARGGGPIADPDQAADTAATAVDAPPHGISHQDEGERNRGAGGDAGRSAVMDAVPNWKRVAALIVIFAIVIVFWMVFHQNGSTLTYFADDNTDWDVSGVISTSINAFFVVAFTFPLVWLWGFLDKRGKEPSTPTKMAIGMTLTGISFLALWLGASIGEKSVRSPEQLTNGEFRINERVLTNLGMAGMSKDALDKIQNAKTADGKNALYGVKFSPKTDEATGIRQSGQDQLIAAVNAVSPGAGNVNREAILQNAHLFRVSPFWLILAYAIVTLGELMLSPMGLSLVSKVAPISIRGLMMGGWFVATAIGNKLTQIGIFWDIWLQSTFFLVLACMALFMAVVLAILLKPLKKAMPGV